MAVAPHGELFTIYAFQEGEAGFADVQALCRYMQEAAGRHAAKLGLSVARLQDEGVAWVLARMRIALRRLPAVHETILVETWPVGVDGVQFRRDYIVRDTQGHELARAVSYWVVVSLETRRIGRVPDFIARVALDNTTTALDDPKPRYTQAGPEHEQCSFRARLGDIDRNQHVNNVRLMDWVLESVPDAVRQEGALVDIDLAFRAEAYRGDRVSARAVPEGDGYGGQRTHSFCHSLVRMGDGRELVRARSIWRKRSPCLVKAPCV